MTGAGECPGKSGQVARTPTSTGELDDFDDEINISPVLSAIALFGVITTVVTIVRTGGRIGHAQKRAMGEDDTSGWLGLLLAFCATLNVAYYQAKLNKLWESQGATRA